MLKKKKMYIMSDKENQASFLLSVIAHQGERWTARQWGHRLGTTFLKCPQEAGSCAQLPRQ